VPIITAIGEIDIATAPLLLDCFNVIPPEAGMVVVDLSNVTFLDSNGLSVLLSGEKRFHDTLHTTRIHLVVARPEILKLFDITGLRAIFPITSTLEEALVSRECPLVFDRSLNC
jgi:anti-anti-sigma factor